MKSCGGTTGHACRLYALDNDVVWQPLPAAPPPSHYAALGDVGALPVPGPAKFTFYPQFLARPSPRALVLGTDGRGYGVYGDHAFEQALVNCQAVSAGCAAYVVNDAVVWAAAANQP